MNKAEKFTLARRFLKGARLVFAVGLAATGWFLSLGLRFTITEQYPKAAVYLFWAVLADRIMMRIRDLLTATYNQLAEDYNKMEDEQ